jgi:threonine/homoserine/homoserine lactone efflux protein
MVYSGMIDLPLLFAFLATILVLVVTPGVDTAIVLRTATADGRQQAALAACGVALGCLCWGAIASLGLGALLRASVLAYTVVKFAGAAYLTWLGVRLLITPRRALHADAGLKRSANAQDAFLRGFLSNILNPKVGVFYVTFLPQFVPPRADVAVYSFCLACLHVILTLAWFAALIAATVPLKTFFQRPQAVKILDRVTGGVFVAFALKLAASATR